MWVILALKPPHSSHLIQDFANHPSLSPSACTVPFRLLAIPVRRDTAPRRCPRRGLAAPFRLRRLFTAPPSLALVYSAVDSRRQSRSSTQQPPAPAPEASADGSGPASAKRAVTATPSTCLSLAVYIDRSISWPDRPRQYVHVRT